MKRQNYDRETIVAIQRQVGATQDGRFGPETVLRIAEWEQKHRNLSGGFWRDAWDKSQGRKVGVWWDLPSKDTTERAAYFAKNAHDVGLNHVHVEVNKSARLADGSLDWDWSKEQLAKFNHELLMRDVEMGVLGWAWPTKASIDEFVDGLVDRCNGLTISAIEIEAEHNWKRKHLEDFGSLEGAAVYYVGRLRDEFPGVKILMTTYPYHGEMGQHPTFAPIVDGVSIQAYSRNVDGNPDYSWGGRFGPGQMQRLAHRRATEAGAKMIIMGLANYGQTIDNRPPIEAMRVAADAFPELVLMYWSRKWFERNGYAEIFIESITS
jgi:hypothetical protein